MKHIKNYNENLLFYKKSKQIPELDTEYLYDDPFYDNGIYYICTKCNSYKLKKITKSGLQPPEYKCENCGKMNYAPESMEPDEYKNFLKDNEIH